MATSAGETRLPLLRSLGELVRSDLLVQVAVGTFLLAVLLGSFPWLPASRREWTIAYALPVLLHGLTVLALLWQRRRIPRREEQRFWGDLAIAFGAWLGVDLLYLYPTGGGYRPGWVYLGAEVLFSVFYLALVLALERQPHRYDRWRPAGLEGMLIRPTMAVFIAGLAVYFLIVPVAIDPGSYVTFLPSMFFYLTLDAFLVGKVLLLWRAAGDRRWRSLYALVAATIMLASASDLVECLDYLLPGWTRPAETRPLWLAIYLPVIFAARLRHRRFPEVEKRPPKPRTAEEELATPSLTTLLLALSFPAIHLGAYAGGWLDELAEPARELVVMAELSALGTIALVQHRLFRQRAHQLEAQRTHAERALRKSESSVRLMLERRQNEELLHQAEERFAKIFRSAPAGLVITTVPEGRMLELNEHFQQLSGFDREELLGRTTREIRFWCRESDREEMMRRLREEGSVRDLVAQLRTRSGDRIEAMLSAEPLEIDGEACLLTVVRDITERQRAEERRRARATLLDLADAAVMVVDAGGRIAYHNQGAEELAAADGIRLPPGGRRVPLRGEGDADGEELWIARPASSRQTGRRPA